jgi:hypothetical protein
VNASVDRHRGALEAIDRILNRGGDADDVLRAVLEVLHRLYPFVAIAFVENGAKVGGPSLGDRPDAWETWPIAFNGMRVAVLEVAGTSEAERPFLERVALVISPYCLVGWDTGGEPWTP